MHTELKPGQLIKVRGVNGRRLAAFAFVAFAAALALRTGTTVVTTGEGIKPVAAQCGTGGGGSGHHGGGTIHIGG